MSEMKELELRYRDNGDNTITDMQHGLMWIKNPGLLDEIAEFRVLSKFDWRTASQVCTKLQFAGYSNWRLAEVPDWDKLCGQVEATLFYSVFEEEYLVDRFWTASVSQRERGHYYQVQIHYLRVIVSGPFDISSRARIWPLRDV